MPHGVGIPTILTLHCRVRVGKGLKRIFCDSEVYRAYYVLVWDTMGNLDLVWTFMGYLGGVEMVVKSQKYYCAVFL